MRAKKKKKELFFEKEEEKKIIMQATNTYEKEDLKTAKFKKKKTVRELYVTCKKKKMRESERQSRTR